MDNALLYRALADESRRRIILLLLRHNCCVSALARKLDISESAVSQHLRLLRQAGLLTGERRGRFMHYAIDRERLRALAREIDAMADLETEDNDVCSAHAGHLCHDMPKGPRLPMAPLPEKRR